MAWPRRINKPSSSYSPASTISPGSTRMWSTWSNFRVSRSWRSNPRERTLFASSPAVSSNAMKTPGSPCSSAPRTRNSIASKVFPEPAPPHTSVARPSGRPPPVISSSPWISVGHLARPGATAAPSGDADFMSASSSGTLRIYRNGRVMITKRRLITSLERTPRANRAVRRRICSNKSARSAEHAADPHGEPRFRLCLPFDLAAARIAGAASTASCRAGG